MHSKIRTGSRSHKSIWLKELQRGKDSRFKGNYDTVPKGMVFEFKGIGFKVYVNDWIDDYAEAKELIVDEFELPRDKTEFVKDAHWDCMSDLPEK